VKTVQSGELSRLAGISTDTLRHYERLGVLPKPPRTNGGYRDYAANSLERVRLIQSALKVGFSLAELATILRMRDRGEVPCHRVRAIAEHKLQEVKQQIKDLLGMRDQLERILKDWDARLARTGKGKTARLLESLPHDVIGTNPRRLTAKHLRRGLR
jgi:MerR family transcriptional regulator, mercuric resistance operon regulatory protein